MIQPSAVNLTLSQPLTHPSVVLGSSQFLNTAGVCPTAGAHGTVPSAWNASLSYQLGSLSVSFRHFSVTFSVKPTLTASSKPPLTPHPAPQFLHSTSLSTLISFAYLLCLFIVCPSTTTLQGAFISFMAYSKQLKTVSGTE